MTSTWPGAPLDLEMQGFLGRLQTGAPDAYEEMVSSYGPALYSTALRITGSPSDAEDALQETLLSAYQHMQSFEERSSLKTWLTRICINAALTRLRRNGRHKSESLDDPADQEGLPRLLPDLRENPEQEVRVCTSISPVVQRAVIDKHPGHELPYPGAFIVPYLQRGHTVLTCFTRGAMVSNSLRRPSRAACFSITYPARPRLLSTGPYPSAGRPHGASLRRSSPSK
jgi:RNA polymerase sigma factor (sigma-70 family)